METLLGVVVGGVLAIGGGILAKYYEEARQRKSLRAAFRAEIASIVLMFETRGHQQLFEDLLENWRSGGDHRARIFGSTLPHSDAVISKNSDKIGLLGQVAGEVVRFYSIMDGVREDIRSLAAGELNHLRRDTKIRLIEEDLRLWGHAKEIAGRIDRMI